MSVIPSTVTHCGLTSAGHRGGASVPSFVAPAYARGAPVKLGSSFRRARA